jgi:hypothetical protein
MDWGLERLADVCLLKKTPLFKKTAAPNHFLKLFRIFLLVECCLLHFLTLYSEYLEPCSILVHTIDT